MSDHTTICISVPAFRGTLFHDEFVYLDSRDKNGRPLVPPGAVTGHPVFHNQSRKFQVPYTQPYPYVGFTLRVDGPFVEATGLETE